MTSSFHPHRGRQFNSVRKGKENKWAAIYPLFFTPSVAVCRHSDKCVTAVRKECLYFHFFFFQRIENERVVAHLFFSPPPASALRPLHFVRFVVVIRLYIWCYTPPFSYSHQKAQRGATPCALRRRRHRLSGKYNEEEEEEKKYDWTFFLLLPCCYYPHILFPFPSADTAQTENIKKKK